MLFDIHAAMQDADNIDPFSGVTVKNHMLADAVFEISFPNIIACPTQTGLIRQIMKGVVKLGQIATLLGLAPLLARVTSNAKQVILGFLCEDERPHLVFAFQFIQYVLQGIISKATLLALGQGAAQRFQLGLTLFQQAKTGTYRFAG